MYLPTKSVRPDECLLTVGAQIISLLHSARDASWLWDEYLAAQVKNSWRPITFDWFCLALDALYAAWLIDLDHDGRVRLRHVS